jgi:mannosyltransferase OCH1-like enzyme
MLFYQKNKEIDKNKIYNIKETLKLQNLKIPYPIKENYNIKIPTNIFQTWHSKILPPLMYNATIKIQKLNPRFNYCLYDDNACYKFIEQNFSEDVLNAYKKLKPGAYKADLWRYCVLYKYGGIYLDIKYVPINNFRFINLTEKEHWVLDIDNNNIYNALIVSLPENPILVKAINQIVLNVKNNYYGRSPLDPTGPGLLSKYFTAKEEKHFDMKHDIILSDFNNRVIYFNNYIILKSYNNSLKEKQNFQKVKYYANLWHEKNIYN